MQHSHLAHQLKSRKSHPQSILVIEQKLKDVKEVSKRPPGEQEMELYLASGDSLNIMKTQYHFGFSTSKYPLLSSFAVKISSSSAPIECMLSTARILVEKGIDWQTRF